MADGESLFRGALAAQYPEPVFVCTELPDDLEQIAKTIRVTMLPSSRRFTLIKPGISIDCFAAAANPADARIAARALAIEVDKFIVFTMAHSVIAGVAISQIETISGPAQRPYANTNLRRFGMTYRPTLRDIA